MKKYTYYKKFAFKGRKNPLGISAYHIKASKYGYWECYFKSQRQVDTNSK